MMKQVFMHTRTLELLRYINGPPRKPLVSCTAMLRDLVKEYLIKTKHYFFLIIFLKVSDATSGDSSVIAICCMRNLNILSSVVLFLCVAPHEKQVFITQSTRILTISRMSSSSRCFRCSS